jgi:hypothetical protein
MAKALWVVAVFSLVFASGDLTALESRQVLFVPVAAHLPASGGKTWSSDLNLYNAASNDASAELTFFAAGSDNSSASEVAVTVPAGRALLLEDVVARTFGFEGYGAVRIRSSVSLLASSTTFVTTPSPFPGITVPRTETFQTPAVDETEWAATASRVLFVANRFRDIEAGPSVRDSYTNIGLFNPSSDTVSVAFTLIEEARPDPLGTGTISLPPYGLTQVVDLFGYLGVSDVQTDNAILLIVASRGSFQAFGPAPLLAYAVRQTTTFADCSGTMKQADFLFAQRVR